MKKILVVLLVLAVAGGVFAQGEWSVGAGAHIGSIINFNSEVTQWDAAHTYVTGMRTHPKMTAGDDNEAVITGIAWDTPYGWWNGIKGTFDINYKLGGLAAGVEFNTMDPIFVNFTYEGDNYKFRAKSNLYGLLGGSSAIYDKPASGAAKQTGDAYVYRSIDRLWGNYLMLNGMFKLEVAYKADDYKYWTSDTTAGDAFARHDRGDFGKPYNNQRNFILGQLSFSNLEMGLILPNVFYGHSADLEPTADANYSWCGWNGTGNLYTGTNVAGMKFVDDVFKNVVFGLKFDMSMINFAVQFTLRDYGTYVGLTWNIFEALSAGFSFQGSFPGDTDNYGNKKTAAGATDMTGKVGGQVNYDAGAFGVGVKMWYEMIGKTLRNDNDELKGGKVAIMPNFWYKIIPSHLAIKVDAGFSFDGYGELGWMVSPMLFWNFKGDGAGTGPADTGIAIRYVLRTGSYCGDPEGGYSTFDKYTKANASSKDTVRNMNNLDVTFKWSM